MAAEEESVQKDAPSEELPELPEEDREVLAQIERRLRKEVKEIPSSRPLRSALQLVVDMAPDAIERLIEAQHASAKPPCAPSQSAAPEAPPDGFSSTLQPAPAAPLSQQDEGIAMAPAPDSVPCAFGLQTASWRAPAAAAAEVAPEAKPPLAVPVPAAALPVGRVVNNGTGGSNAPSASTAAVPSKPARAPSQSEEPKGKGGGKTDEELERVLIECRQTFLGLEDRRLLLSKLGAGLSYSSRSILDARGTKLSRFLSAYPREFKINKSGDGRESITYTPLEEAEEGYHDKNNGGKGSGNERHHSTGNGGSERHKNQQQQWRETTSRWQPKVVPKEEDEEATYWAAKQSTPGKVQRKLYVGNLPVDVTREEIASVFCRYGYVEDIKIMHGRSRRTTQSCAFVVFATAEEAKACVKKADKRVEVRPGTGTLIVKYATDNDSSNSGVPAPKLVSSGYVGNGRAATAGLRAGGFQ
eukprot:TRINITY_DN24229_c0_g1_i1.p1 TRINITY_DN24229_c0_g1~~TRINITY_DN24229_c0_g1_i1.p1  ORF type:complete len:471 (-),score=104.07 TRINITY_DN24229_c0_g1_i1:180-1592(-)